jgi:hypothetical protein
MQSYDGFRLITNFFFFFLSKAVDRESVFGQIGETGLISVHFPDYFAEKTFLRAYDTL